MLLLFDVDGTLVGAATDAHRDALHHALSTVHGVQGTVLPISPAGRTDGEIARMILLAAGIPPVRIDRDAGAVREQSTRAYARLCPADLSHTVLPGVRDLLRWLSGREDVVLALLTGNYEPIARLKLASAGIGGHFPPGQGAFGSDAEDRCALPAIARERAGDPGAPYPRERTIVIGDTPRDIACARADGLRCLAVATGPYAAAQLEHADEVLGDADGLRTALATTLGVSP
ncbi:MAG: haloacid dehalogenase-like hydrolase [Solirubrobacteraceae bacterium]